MELDILQRNHLVTNFRRYVIVVELWRPEVARRWRKCRILAFLKKRPLTENLFCFERIHCLTERHVVFKFREIWLTGKGKGKVVRYLPEKETKIRIALKILLLCGSHPKSARAGPRQCTAPDFIQIGSLSVELYTNAWTPFERVPECTFFYSAEA